MVRFAVSKIISQKQEELTGYDVVLLTFAEAYADLRRTCPDGDLRIHLSVDKAFRDLGERDEHGNLRTASERWPDGAPT